MDGSALDIQALANRVKQRDNLVLDAYRINRECIYKIISAQKEQNTSDQEAFQNAQQYGLDNDEYHHKQMKLSNDQVMITADSALYQAIDAAKIAMSDLELKHANDVSVHTDNKIINLTVYSVIMLMLDIFLFLSGYTHSFWTSLSFGLAMSVATLTILTPVFFDSATAQMKMTRNNTILIAICTAFSLISLLL